MQSRPNQQRLRFAGMVGLLAILIVAVMAIPRSGVSAASSNPPPTVNMSSAACLWLQRNAAHANGMSCLQSPATGGAQANTAKGKAGNATNTSFSAADPAHGLSQRPKFGPNVDATSPNEDLAAGQSETAIAAAGKYVVSLWNDGTGFLIADSTAPGGSLTGAGFSSDGGNSFQDLGGLPNNNPCQRIFGDPSVVSYKAPDGTTYFYATSLYLPDFGPACTSTGTYEVSLSVGTVSGNSISFANPIVVANGGFFFPGPFLGLLDKDFATIDRASGKLAVSYTCFGFFGGPSGSCGPSDIEIALCDLSNPAVPTCNPGTTGATYLTIATAPPSPIFGPFSPEELEGAYPAFSGSGDLYVVWNQNWTTNFFDGDPFTYQFAARVQAGCLTFPTTTCGTPAQVQIGSAVKSLDATTIAGYSRGIGNDFPRIAFNNTTNQVVFVWNEANAHPLGDIVMVTAAPDLSTQSAKTIVNDDNASVLHFLPAVSIDASGDTNISWYDRRNSNGTAFTDVFAASIRPGDPGGRNGQVTTVATDWLATGSFINPNFGDYTDNTSYGGTFYVNWSDGRLGVPNSFVASAGS